MQSDYTEFCEYSDLSVLSESGASLWLLVLQQNVSFEGESDEPIRGLPSSLLQL